MVSAAPMDDMYDSHAAMNNTIDLPAPACCMILNTSAGQDRIGVETHPNFHNPVFQFLYHPTCVLKPAVTRFHPCIASRILAPDPKFETAGFGKRE
jgi:hypothetical protein